MCCAGGVPDAAALSSAAPKVSDESRSCACVWLSSTSELPESDMPAVRRSFEFEPFTDAPPLVVVATEAGVGASTPGSDIGVGISDAGCCCCGCCTW